MPDFSLPSLVILALAALVVVALRGAIKIVPQSENWLVERLGKYHRKLEAGLHLLIPFFETVQHRIPIQERQLPPRPINAITLDNVTISISLAVLYRIADASRTVYRISNVDDAIITIVNGTVRSVIGKTDLDGVQSNRRQLSTEIEEDLRAVSDEWGIVLTRVEILEVDVDQETRQAMQRQINAERDRRARVLDAEGNRKATELDADAQLYAAQKQAEAVRIRADAEAYAVGVVAKAIADGGASAVDFEVRKLQAGAVETLAQGSNSKIVLVPSDVLNGLTGIASRLAGKL
ncbi:MAG: SPFH domain-containing protein [Betaproteobacteria bacterium]|jgi:regulator of protease activity HflC (stomatin/prohibitin superfamily)